MKKFIAVFFAVMVAALVSFTPSKALAAECEAVTYCPNLGTTVYCWANSGPYGSCTWYVQPQAYVTCTGMMYNPYSGWQWRTVTMSCWR